MNLRPESPDSFDEVAREAETRVLEWLDRERVPDAERPATVDRRPPTARRHSGDGSTERRAGESQLRVSPTLEALVRRLVRVRESERAASDSINAVMAAVVRAVELGAILEPLAADCVDTPAAAVEAFACREDGHAAAAGPSTGRGPEPRGHVAGGAEHGNEREDQ